VWTQESQQVFYNEYHISMLIVLPTKSKATNNNGTLALINSTVTAWGLQTSVGFFTKTAVSIRFFVLVLEHSLQTALDVTTEY
jgi:hypothetical protein